MQTSPISRTSQTSLGLRLGVPVKRLDLEQQYLGLRKKWWTKYCPDVITIRRESLKPAEELIKRWTKIFPKEDTLAQKFYNIPSFVVGVDCIIDEKTGRFGLYEIDEKPTGIGLACFLNESFKAHLHGMLAWWPYSSITVLISKDRRGCDDQFWTTTTSNQKDFNTHSLFIIRAEPGEIGKFNGFEGNSGSSLLQDGNKSYGVELGLWRETTPRDLENPELWKENFVLKPCQGRDSKDIMIWINGYNGNYGTSSEGQIRKKLNQNGRMYMQEFIPPLTKQDSCGCRTVYWKTIYRILFAYDVDFRKYVALGGFWIMRNNYKVQVAPDSLTGQIILI